MTSDIPFTMGSKTALMRLLIETSEDCAKNRDGIKTVKIIENNFCFIIFFLSVDP